MIKLKHGVQVLLGCTLIYATACGGSTSPGDAGGSSTAGSTASFAGARSSGGASMTSAGSFSQSGGYVETSGSGDGNGASTGVAGAESAIGGDTSGGGASGVAGNGAGGTSIGTGGVIGSAGQNSCPPTAPADRSMCTSASPGGETCLYVGESCACRAPIVIAPRPGGGAAGGASLGGGGAGVGAGGAASTGATWRCTGSGAACPTTVPTTGDMCTNPAGAGGAGPGIASALDCPYPNGKTCRCTNRRWECTEPPPPACPAKQPTGACTTVQACNYGTAAMRIRCACDSANWACDMPGGAAPRCTAKARAALATGDTCTGIGECAVVGATTTTCVCNGKTVTCN